MLVGETRVDWLLSPPGSATGGSHASLTDREAAVVAALPREGRRAEWMAGRAVAKALLARVAGDPGGKGMRFEILPDAGRVPIPGIVDAGGQSHTLGYSLSISHRAGAAAAAVVPSASGRVGIDVEVMEARSDALLADYFSADEARLLAGLSGMWRAHGIALLWSIKEALLKAAGVGLSVPADDAEILALEETVEDGGGIVRGRACLKGCALAAGHDAGALLACLSRPPFVVSLAVVRAMCR